MYDLHCWEYGVLHPRLSCLHQRLIQNINVWKRRRNMKRWIATEQLASRGNLLAWRANTTLCHNTVLRGEQTLLSVTLQLAVASKITRRGESWQSSVGNDDFSPQFSNTPIPNLIENSTYNNFATWTSIIQESNGVSTLLTTKFLLKT